jgi:hypothetical protein
VPNPSDPFDFGPPARQPDAWGSAQPASGTPGDPWQAESPTTAAAAPVDDIRPVGPPAPLLFGAAAGVVLGALLVVLAAGVPAAMLVAWAAAGPVAIALVGFFLGADADRRSHPYYLQQAWTATAPVVIVVVGFLVVVASSWFFADWAARQ